MDQPWDLEGGLLWWWPWSTLLLGPGRGPVWVGQVCLVLPEDQRQQAERTCVSLHNRATGKVQGLGRKRLGVDPQVPTGKGRVTGHPEECIPRAEETTGRRPSRESPESQKMPV